MKNAQISVNDAATDSDIDRRAADRLDEAVAIISQYVDPANFHLPLWDSVSVQTNVVELQRLQAKGVPNATSQAERKFRKLLKDNCVDPDLRLGRVQLAQEIDDRPSFLGYPDDPQLVFAALSTNSGRYVAGEREAFVAYFSPLVSDMRKEPMIHPATGEPHWLPWGQRFFTDRMPDTDGSPKVWLTSNDFDANSYVGVIRWFHTVEVAEEELNRCRYAMSVLTTDWSGTAQTADPVRYAVSPAQAQPEVF